MRKRAWIRSLLVLGLLAASTACQVGDARVPTQLRGEWRTDAARYEDRYMILVEDTVVFGGDDGFFELCPIRKIDVSEEGRRYVLHYVAENGEPGKLSFGIASLSPIVLEMTNQPSVRWRRATK